MYIYMLYGDFETIWKNFDQYLKGYLYNFY